MDEWQARSAEVERPEIVALCDARDPAERSGAWRQLQQAESQMAGAWQDVIAARDDAARRAGAAAFTELVAASHPEPPRERIETFERGAIEPLDREIERSGRERARRAAGRVAGADRVEAAGTLWSLTDHAERFDPGRSAATLDALERGLGLGRRGDPLRVRPGRRWWSLGLDRLPGGAGLLLGACPGPGGLRRTLFAYGVARRGAFLRTARGSTRLAGLDPALSAASGVLFRRLLLNRAFTEWVGIPMDDGLAADLRFEEALAPRLAWAYVHLGYLPGSGTAQTADGERLWGRATGRAASPRRLEGGPEGDVDAARGLVGEALGALLEERLLRRHGSRWFLDRQAGRLLEMLWDAESGLMEAAEVSRQADLGTIDFAPILDRFRP